MQKTLHLIARYNAPGGFYLEIALKYRVKQSKNSKFPSNCKLAQSILKRKFPSIDKPPPNIGPSKNKPIKKVL